MGLKRRKNIRKRSFRTKFGVLTRKDGGETRRKKSVMLMSSLPVDVVFVVISRSFFVELWPFLARLLSFPD